MKHKLLIIYLILFLPVIIYNLERAQKLKSLASEHRKLEAVSGKILSFCNLKDQNNQTITKYKNTDPDFLYKNLESLTLSKHKIQLVETFGDKNKFYSDKYESLAKPIDVDLEDVRLILQSVEGNAHPQKPLLFFSDFSLKKNSDPENITYNLNFKITKRDYS